MDPFHRIETTRQGYGFETHSLESGTKFDGVSEPQIPTQVSSLSERGSRPDNASGSSLQPAIVVDLYEKAFLEHSRPQKDVEEALKFLKGRKQFALEDIRSELGRDSVNYRALIEQFKVAGYVEEFGQDRYTVCI